MVICRFGGETRSLDGEERVSGGDTCTVVLKALPGAPLEVVEAQLAFHLLVVALDSPSEFCQADQFLAWC